MSRKILVVYENLKYSNPICYVFSIIFEELGCDYVILSKDKYLKSRVQFEAYDLGIYYGRERLRLTQNKNICITESNFWHDFLKMQSYPSLPLKEYKGMQLIYCKDKPLTITNDIVTMGFDMVASIFFMLARYEEKLLNKFDEYGRFRAKDSLAYKANFLHRPIVNEYIHFLGQLCEQMIPDLKCKQQNKKMRIFLSHDIDHLKMSLLDEVKGLIFSILKRKGVGPAFSRFFLALKVWFGLEDDPYFNLVEIIKLEKEAGYKSTFFLAAKTSSKYDPKYDICSSRISQSLKSINEMEWDIGLHGSYDSMEQGERLKAGKSSLERVVGRRIAANRQHYLRWRMSVTPRLLEEAGLLFDFSVGFADAPGFRSGYCMPYKPFDIDLNRTLDIYEVPLIVMDDTLYKYQRYSPAEAFDLVISLAETTNKYGGIFTLLWHNTFLSVDNITWHHVYLKMLDYFVEKRIPCITVRDLERNLLRKP